MLYVTYLLFDRLILLIIKKIAFDTCVCSWCNQAKFHVHHALFAMFLFFYHGITLKLAFQTSKYAQTEWLQNYTDSIVLDAHKSKFIHGTSCIFWVYWQKRKPRRCLGRDYIFFEKYVLSAHCDYHWWHWLLNYTVMLFRICIYLS